MRMPGFFLCALFAGIAAAPSRGAVPAQPLKEIICPDGEYSRVVNLQQFCCSCQRSRRLIRELTAGGECPGEETCYSVIGSTLPIEPLGQNTYFNWEFAEDLTFGTITPNHMGGGVTISYAGEVTSTYPPKPAGATSHGQIDFGIQQGYCVSGLAFSLPTSVTLTGSAGGALELTNINGQLENYYNGMTSLDIDQPKLYYGGTLGVPASTPAGDYTGSMIVGVSGNVASAPGLKCSGLLPFRTFNMTAQVRAKIIKPISVTQVQPLYFGQIKIPRTGDCVTTLTANYLGGAARTGSCIAMTDIYTPGVFYVAGIPGMRFTVTLPDSAEMGTMTLSDFNYEIDLSSTDGQTGELSSSGGANFVVGATITIPRNQSLGRYSTSYTVQVNY